MEMPQDSLALDTPYQMGSGYTSLDQSTAVIIIADAMMIEGEQNASAEEQSTSAAAE
jgi:hypothetical protein